MPRLLAVAEIRQAKGRFALLIVGSGLLVFVLLFQQVLLAAVLEGLTGAVSHQSGNLIVFAAQARRNVAGSLVIPAQLEAIRRVGGVADASELAATMLSMSSAGPATEVAIIGYRPGRAGTPEGVVAGRQPVVASEALASEEDAAGRYGLGAVVKLQPGGTELTIVGLTAGSRYNVAPTLWVPWDGYGRAVRGAHFDALTVLPSVVAVRTADGFDPDAVGRSISGTVAGTDVVRREDAVTDSPEITAVRAAFAFMLGLGYLAVGLVVSFFFLILTVQKAPSLILLRAIGAPERYLVITLWQQVAVVTVGGLVVGIALLVVALPFVPAVLPVSVSPATVVVSALVALGVAFVGSIPPMRRILHADPVAVVGPAHPGGLGRLG
jgi:putative ABC transport system permease protein